MTRRPRRATRGSASSAAVHLFEISVKELGADAAPGSFHERGILLFYGNDTEGTHGAAGTRAGDACRERDQAVRFDAPLDELRGNDRPQQRASSDTCRRAVVNTARIADLFRQIADAIDERPANSNAKARKRRRPSITKTRPPGESDERARAEARRILRERGFVGGNSDD